MLSVPYADTNRNSGWPSSGHPLPPLSTLAGMDSFSDRLLKAMAEARPPVSQNELARHLKTSQGTVSGWVRGLSKGMEMRFLYPAARKLQVRPEWLAMGEGEMRAMNAQVHQGKLELSALSEALRWCDYFEAVAGEMGYKLKAETLSDIYFRLVADGGSASPQTADSLIQQAKDRAPAEKTDDRTEPAAPARSRGRRA